LAAPSSSEAGVAAYESLAYPGYAYPATHPARLEAVARLFGLRPAPAASARVLELGCGDGGNLLSLAQALPGASLIGIDASASAVERGNALARSAGLRNVQLRCMDIAELPDDQELAGVGFDYILAHGVYSWVPPAGRTALLESVRRHLEPMGVAYVSYNAYPGSYLRDMARDILAYHVRDVEEPAGKLLAAQELMRTIVEIEEPSPYAQVLREHMERMLGYSDALLFHDDLAEISTPFYFHEFMEHANRHGLTFLAEADLFESQMRGVPPSTERLLAELPDDVVVREQYLDFFKNRMFRQTLLCHEHAPVSRAIDERTIELMAVSSQARAAAEQAEGAGEHVYLTPEGFSMTTSEPLVIAAMQALEEAWPASVEFPVLCAAARAAVGVDVSVEQVTERLCTILLHAYLARIVVLQGCAPPLVAHPSERPLANPLARAQRQVGQSVLCSLLHGNVRLVDELELELVPLLDGEHDREALVSALGVEGQRIDGALARLASVGLLEG
jgi:SAM-dependent methyltransferase